MAASSTLAGPRLARARTATVRRDLIAVPARAARSGRDGLTLHLPEGHHRAHEWLAFRESSCGPPSRAA